MKEIIDKQRQYFNTDETRNIKFRLTQLKNLELSILSHYEDLVRAFKADYNKCEFDMLSNELSITMNELRFMKKHIKRLASPKRVHTSIINFYSRGYISPSPYGVTLIVSPWNYPLQLSLVPLIASIAAGNTTILKLSANTPNITKTITDILSIFEDKYVYVTKPEDRDKIFDGNYDFCFYTGSTKVGKDLLARQAQYLTPCVLELGGKSPCIIDEDADIDRTARRLVWGKYLNAGQTCVAPDYVLVHNNVKDKLIEKLQYYIHKFYYDNNGKLTDNFTHIVNQKATDHLLSLIQGEHIICGGNSVGRCLEPTILDNISFDSKIMQEEIFGPILPIITYTDINEIISKLKTLEKPLALYYFGKQNEKRVLYSLNFGGGCVNDTIMHLTEESMPFGGVGFSGMGSYHGKKSFETFSHNRSILKKGKIEMPTKYPPYTKGKIRLIKLLFHIKHK